MGWFLGLGLKGQEQRWCGGARWHVAQRVLLVGVDLEWHIFYGFLGFFGGGDSDEIRELNAISFI